ncbi:hypothetical protein ABZS61_31520 [Streptomyces sp. NPDC005566]|uniref:hypothetical protein n=1 Tax=Streptomyces sp. NPDC005566 TaxID=3156886 RepID=UPI0033AA5904
METRISGTEELPAARTLEQQQLLQAVWDAFTASSEWPTFGWVDRKLDKQGLDVVAAISQLPEDMLRGFPDPSRPVPSDDSVIPSSP